MGPYDESMLNKRCYSAVGLFTSARACYQMKKTTGSDKSPYSRRWLWKFTQWKKVAMEDRFLC